MRRNAIISLNFIKVQFIIKNVIKRKVKIKVNVYKEIHMCIYNRQTRKVWSNKSQVLC